MKITQIGAFEAKTHFSELLEKVSRGDSYIVTRRGKPVARLVPNEVRESRPVYGSTKGKIRMKPDFNSPLSDMADYES